MHEDRTGKGTPREHFHSLLHIHNRTRKIGSEINFLGYPIEDSKSGSREGVGVRVPPGAPSVGGRGGGFIHRRVAIFLVGRPLARIERTRVPV